MAQQSLQFTGEVKSPATEGTGLPHGCSAAELFAAMGLQFEPIVQLYDRVLGGRYVFAQQAGFIAMPIVKEMTTVSFLAMALEQDSVPVALYIGTVAANEGSFTVGSNLVLTPGAIPGANFFIKGGAAVLKLIVAGT
jgi:hypothetical protein